MEDLSAATLELVVVYQTPGREKGMFRDELRGEKGGGPGRLRRRRMG
jgi:hypothetical protein